MKFDIDPDKNEKLFKNFDKLLSKRCLKNSKVISTCYKNKIELGCKYGDPIDTIISEVEKEMKEGDPNWWVDILT